MKNLITHSSSFPGHDTGIPNSCDLRREEIKSTASTTGAQGNKLFVLLMVCLALFSKTATASALAPVISSLSAKYANPGSNITISGSNFNTTAASNIVYFGGKKANVVTASGTSLTVTVPVGATYAPVTVTNSANGLTGYSPYPFEPTYNNAAYATNVVNFDTSQYISTSGNLSSVVLGDIDGDGKLDMITGNFVTRLLLVYRNVSVSGTLNASSFASPVSFISDTGVFGLAVGDVDGDGKLDIVATSNADTGITVYRNTSSPGSISLAGGMFLATPYAQTTGAVITDLDRDGKSDIAVAFQYGVFVFHSTSSVGALSFDAGAYVDAAGTGGMFGPTQGGMLAAGDLDGDGKTDLATNSYGTNQVVVLRNTSSLGSISFATKQIFSVGDAPTNVAMGDLDGDGKQELVTTNQGTSYTDTGSVSVLRNTSSIGSVSFATAQTFLTGTDPSSVAIASMTGGAKPDLVVTAFNSYNLSVLRNTSSTGSLSFDTVGHQFYEGEQAWMAAVGDIDGDGKPDVVVSNYMSFLGGSSIEVLRNEPLGLLTGPALACTLVMDSFASASPQGLWSSSDSSVAIAYTGIYNFKAYIQGISAGTATLTYTVLGGYTTVTVNVANGVPSPGTIGGASSVNAGSNITLTDAVAGGVWSASNGNATVAAGVVHGVTAGTVVISYTITNGCGWDYTTKTVTVNAGTPITVSAITGAFTMCAGATGPFFDATPGGTWSINSADAAVASVGTTGIVTAISAGTAQLSYTVGSSYATRTITVNPVPAAINGTASVCQGATTTLSDATAGGTWSSAIPSTATVGTGGVVTAVNAGTVTIYYTLPVTGCRASKIVTINVNPAAITGPTKVCTGLSITLSDATAGGTWSGSNAYGTVSGSGIITGVAAGTVPVTYTAGTGCLKIASILVNASPAAVSGNLSVCTGSVTHLTDATTPGVSWTSSTPAVATINASGNATGISAGTATVTYTATNLCIATAVVTVNTTPTVTAIMGASSVSRTGPGITLTDATSGGLWSSSNTAILTVGSTTGLVTALVSTGSANIIYTVTNVAGCSATVSKSISTSPAPRGHGGTTTTTVGATVSVADEATGGAWTSSNDGIATVDEYGTVSAISEGAVVITHVVTNSDGSASATTSSVVVEQLPMTATLVPNPNNGTFSIKGMLGTTKDAVLTYQVTDMLGQVVYTTKATAIAGIINEQMQLSNSLANGMYLLNINSGNEHRTIHFVIEK